MAALVTEFNEKSMNLKPNNFDVDFFLQQKSSLLYVTKYRNFFLVIKFEKTSYKRRYHAMVIKSHSQCPVYQRAMLITNFLTKVRR